MLNSPGARRHKARALVVSSATLRMVLRGIDWVAPPPFASRYFQRASSALSWLGVQRPRLDLERLRAHLLRDVPPALAAASGLTRPLQFGAVHSVPG